MRDRLVAALESLVEHDASLARISIDRLASAAGVARSTFYVHFKDKADLVGVAIERITSEVDDVHRLWWQLGPESSYADLRAALGRIAQAYRPHLRLLGAAFDAAAYDPGVRAHAAGMVDRYATGLAEHIERGQRGGWVSPGMPPAEGAAWILWMAERGQHRILVSATDEELELQVDAFAQIVWNTLYAFAPSRS